MLCLELESLRQTLLLAIVILTSSITPEQVRRHIPADDRDLPFTQFDEFATMPPVEELIIITKISPWCTFVRNENGVPLGYVCVTLWKQPVLLLLWRIRYPNVWTNTGILRTS